VRRNGFAATDDARQKQLMKLALILGLSLGLAWTVFAADDASVVKTPKGKMSYGLGMDIGKNITNTLLEIDADALAAGLKAVVSGQKPLLSEQEAVEAMNQFRTEMQAKRMQQQKAMQEKNKEVGEKNKKIGDAFLAENKKKEGVKVTPSGLQYKVLTQGKGKIPGSNDTVIAHYRGTLIDGTEFDSSFKRGEPGKFGVTRVIKGWTEALLQMPVGSKWQLFIPADLAYGESGRPSIPASSTLLFDIELIGIEGDEAKPK
jgi:FKBP-type peptidyl-prolyl cis-trans isomerase FklB